MKTKLFWPIALFILFSACNADKELTQPQPNVKETATDNALAHESFKHIAFAATIIGNRTVINHAATNNLPNVILIVTHDWGNAGPNYNEAYAVRYLNGRWNIFSVDGSAIPVNARFNVLVAHQSPGNNAFVHAAPSSGAYTTLNHPGLNNNPNARFLITQLYINSPLVNRPLGVRYIGGRWRIYALGLGAVLPHNTRFHVYIDAHIFLSSPSGYSSFFYHLNSPYTNNGPLRHIFITQYLLNNWNPHYAGVRYFNPDHWAIFNEDGVAIPVGARYFVLSH